MSVTLWRSQSQFPLSPMSQYNATALIVDDQDPRVKYSPGWIKSDNTSAEYLSTKSGANEEGMTATFEFVGTGVEVYGSVGSIDVYGRPVSSYGIDGFAAYSATYQAEIIKPGFFTAHTLFYRSPPLPAGTHQLVITNLNDTAPSLYWLDYILYTPADATTSSSGSSSISASTSSSSSSPSSPSTISRSDIASSALNSGPTSAIVGLSSSSSTTSSVTSSATTPAITSAGDSVSTSASSSVASAPTAVTQPSSRKVSVGAVVGETLAGVVVIILIVLSILYCCRRRRGSGITGSPSPTPFGSWRNANPLPTPRLEEKLQTQDSTLLASGQGIVSYATPNPLAGPSAAPYVGSSSLRASPMASTAILVDANPHASSSAIIPSPLGYQPSPTADSGTSQTTHAASETPPGGPQPGGKFVYVPIMVHEDSGTRFPPQTPDMVELPPEYTRG